MPCEPSNEGAECEWLDPLLAPARIEQKLPVQQERPRHIGRKGKLAFEIKLSPPARKHVEALRKRDQQIVLQAIEVRLRHQPDHPTKQRKLLEENPLAPWELRVGDFRVFYDVDRDATLVIVVAVGKKTHNVLRIGDEEMQL
jgi:mRNA-degrading endonuclease RelE of RelBE toxin-antitoxin system